MTFEHLVFFLSFYSETESANSVLHKSIEDILITCHPVGTYLLSFLLDFGILLLFLPRVGFCSVAEVVERTSEVAD